MGPRAAARRALIIGVIAVALEAMLVTPWMDHAANKNPTVHYTQHGLIFLGGLLMGYAMSELSRR